MVIKSTVY